MSVIEEITVDTRPSKAVVVDSLTRDISIEACIFDLVDNSIDAARNTIVKISGAAELSSPPESYSGYRINIDISGDSFVIDDNCGGITSKHLESSVLRFGERSAHNFGIGVFGVGLNRALFRIGRVTKLVSDTGSERTELDFDVNDYLATEEWTLKAKKLPTRGKVGTRIKISSFTNETSQMLGGHDWIDLLVSEAGKRYGRFIDKGLEVSINDTPVHSLLVRLRPDGPYGKDSKFFKVSDEVSVFIESGQHLHHRFSAEADYNKSRNGKLTSEYGWNVFCNERAVIVSDKTRKSGWFAKFHTEFYGFVGYVFFSCKDPSKLPWNTTKSDVDLNNIAYQLALVDMEKFALKWRGNAGNAKAVKSRDEILVPTPPSTLKPIAEEKKPLASPMKPAPATPLKPSEPVKKPIVKIDHNRFITVLPYDIDEVHCFDKHLALVHEAKRLNLSDLTYAGLVLIRMLFESSAICFLKRRNLFGELKLVIINNRNLERKQSARPLLTVKEEKNSDPSIDEIISFLQGHDAVWDDVSANKIKHSLSKFSSFKPLLNSAAHNNFQMLNKHEAFTVRDAVLPILRHLIEEE
ncbi:ATP-binding protein [Pseudomonas taetrolens]|uniref:ATP-binding protein n=1 Tax=Pseudomonas taetrolens TaxID=47884 RepID=UPI0030DD2E16